MLRLTHAQRRVLTDKVPDLANLAAGGLIVGQFLGDEPFSPSLAFFGMTVWLLLIGFAMRLSGGDET
jgi:hypothetical protein